MNYVTLSSDASPGANATGYAFYLRSDQGTIKKAWFKEGREDTFIAEYNALLAGLKEAVNHIDGETKLIIYCDNRVVLRVIDKTFVPKSSRKYAAYIDESNAYTRLFADVETRHVKAHSRKNDAKKYYMNRWCDINARRQMRYLGKAPIRERLYGRKAKAEAEQTRLKHPIKRYSA